MSITLITPWRRSSRSQPNGNCVEFAIWRKSSRSSTNGACVEFATWQSGAAAGVAVRDSKDTAGPVLTFGDADWSSFLAGVKAGHFDR